VDVYGGFVISWQSFDRSIMDSDILARRFDSSGNPLSGEVRVSTYEPSKQRYAVLAGSGGGSFVAVWESRDPQDGDGAGVYGQRFCDDLVPPDQGNVLRAVRRTEDVLLSFADASAVRWRVLRDTDKKFLSPTGLAPDASVASFPDALAVPGPPMLYFYRIRGISPCTATLGP